MTDYHPIVLDNTTWQSPGSSPRMIVLLARGAYLTAPNGQMYQGREAFIAPSDCVDRWIAVGGIVYDATVSN